MIKAIYSASPDLVVNNGYVSQPYISPGSQSAGMVRWNTTLNCLEVYDGIAWRSLMSNDVSIDFSGAMKSKLEYIDKIIAREQKIEELAKNFPAIDKARQNLDILVKLVENEHTTGQV